MTEAVARALCLAAGDVHECGSCRHCIGADEAPASLKTCALWPSFIGEAEAAIATVRRFAILSMRPKPRPPKRAMPK